MLVLLGAQNQKNINLTLFQWCDQKAASAERTDGEQERSLGGRHISASPPERQRKEATRRKVKQLIQDLLFKSKRSNLRSEPPSILVFHESI